MARLEDASATIVVPVFNNATTLVDVFDSLERQEHKSLVDRVLFIDDASSDESVQLLRAYAGRSSYVVDVIEHSRNVGHAKTLNDGIGRTSTGVVVLMHPDIQLTDPASVKKIIEPLRSGSTFGCYATLLHPRDVWSTYPFWQRCMFSRFVDSEVRFFTPRFAALRRADLVQLGGFDETYRTAGEDGDLDRRAEQRGMRIVPAPVAAVHVHSRDPHFGLGAWIRKEAQLAEAQGVLLRRFGVRSAKDFALSFFRQLLLIGLAARRTRRPAAVLTTAYAMLYTAEVFRRGPIDFRLLVLPVVNLALLPIAFCTALHGFIRGRQTL
jgi:glycosyltransferase involved in cell wall biosynthesis